MVTKILEVEAETLEKARNKISAQIPDGFRIDSETIISDGKIRTVRESSDTIGLAFDNALGNVPNNSTVIEKNEVLVPERKSIIVEAFNEQEAVSNAHLEAAGILGKAAIVQNVELITIGRKGFLGIGKKPNKYEVEMSRQAKVEVIYKSMAKISVKLLDAEAFEEKKRIEEEERRAEDEAERMARLRALMDDEAWRDAHPVPKYF